MLEPTKIIIYLSIHVNEQASLKSLAQDCFDLFKTTLTHIDFEIIDFARNIEREEMSDWFKESSLIFYVCDNQDEIINLINIRSDSIEIGKKRYHDDYYEMHLCENIKSKVSILSCRELEKFNFKRFQQKNLFFLSYKCKRLLKHLIQLSNSNCEQSIFYEKYKNHILVVYILLKLKFKRAFMNGYLHRA